jgi:hypothetical protein
VVVLKLDIPLQHLVTYSMGAYLDDKTRPACSLWEHIQA